MAPRQARVGIVSSATGTVVAVALKWSDAMTELPDLNSIEIWEIFNTTVDAHPIHIHLVGFEVINRETLDPNALPGSWFQPG